MFSTVTVLFSREFVAKKTDLSVDEDCFSVLGVVDFSDVEVIEELVGDEVVMVAASSVKIDLPGVALTVVVGSFTISVSLTGVRDILKPRFGTTLSEKNLNLNSFVFSILICVLVWSKHSKRRLLSSTVLI